MDSGGEPRRHRDAGRRAWRARIRTGAAPVSLGNPSDRGGRRLGGGGGDGVRERHARTRRGGEKRTRGRRADAGRRRTGRAAAWPERHRVERTAGVGRGPAASARNRRPAVAARCDDRLVRASWPSPPARSASDVPLPAPALLDRSTTPVGQAGAATDRRGSGLGQNAEHRRLVLRSDLERHDHRRRSARRAAIAGQPPWTMARVRGREQRWRGCL